MKKQYQVEIPCTILSVESRPDIINFEGRGVERTRHSIRIRLPDGHTVEAVLPRLEIQKVQAIIPTYIVAEEGDSPHTEGQPKETPVTSTV